MAAETGETRRCPMIWRICVAVLALLAICAAEVETGTEPVPCCAVGVLIIEPLTIPGDADLAP